MVIKAKLIDLTFSINGKQRLTIEFDGDFRAEFDKLKDCNVKVGIKKYRKRRSLDANAYCWILIDKIAGVMHTDKTTVYRNAIKEIAGVSEILCLRDEAVDKFRHNWEQKGLGWQTDTMESKIEGCTNVVVYYGSSTYDSKQMSHLIDLLVQDAQSLGIQTDTPDQIAKYKGLWDG